jgi:hypothetical protein
MKVPRVLSMSESEIEPWTGGARRSASRYGGHICQLGHDFILIMRLHTKVPYILERLCGDGLIDDCLDWI